MRAVLAIREFHGAATRREDRLAIVPDAAAEPVAARILPDVLSEAHQMPLMRSIFRRLGGRLLSSERCIILHTVRVFRDPATKMPHARRIVSVAWCGCSGMIAAIGGVGLVDQAAAAGSPTISSSRKGASVSSVMELARRTANSSFHSSGMAPMSRTMASSFCKMPTTSVLRLISLFGRSRGGAESSRGENQRRRPCPCGREGFIISLVLGWV